jgi:M6 family metalloprotease-like protein
LNSTFIVNLTPLRCIALIACLILNPFPGASAPFHDLRVVFSQPDGTPVEVIGSGDEFYARFETLAGYTVIFDTTQRAYCYADLDASGAYVSTSEQAHLADPLELGLKPHLREGAAARKSKSLARWQRWEAGMRIESAWKERKASVRAYMSRPQGGPQPAPPSFPTTGLKVGLTLLIDFDDDPATIPQAEIVRFCNDDNYSGFGNNGSVKSYFFDNSNGLLTYTNIVTIYLRIPNSLHPKSWYSDTTKDCGSQGNLLVRDALNILKALPNYATVILPTFDALTVNSDNEVVACNIFYAGGNGNVWSYGLWPHSWSLHEVGSQEISPGGKKVLKYQLTNLGPTPTLGTFCHENGHLLCGFPDIYDYGSDSTGGAGAFCLMNSGGRGGNPAQICAYLKRASGWASTVELDGISSILATVSVSPGSSFNHFYRYQRPGVPTEYFLLEARHASGRDASLPASGLAIWHIDELGDRDDQSRAFNIDHQNYEVSLEQADNLWHFQNDANTGDANDLYSSQNTAAGYTNAFSDFTSPGAKWWDGLSSGANFYDFSAPGTTMTFKVDFSSIAPQISAHPQTRSVVLSRPVTFGVGAAGSNPLRFQWYHDGNAIGEATNASYLIPSVEWIHQGDYHVVVTNGHGSATSDIATLTVLPGLSLADALDTTNVTWTTVGVLGWATETDTTRDGEDAAQSGPISHSQESLLEAALTGPGTLNFWWKVSSEGNRDFLQFHLDGLLQSGAISGEIEWLQNTVIIPAGPHTARWRYTKDGGVNAGRDRAWVDQVSFIPSQILPPSLSALLYTAGHFQMDISGSPGANYVVLTSSNLLDWVPVRTNTAPFTYSEAGGSDPRFFRARTQF